MKKEREILLHPHSKFLNNPTTQQWIELRIFYYLSGTGNRKQSSIPRFVEEIIFSKPRQLLLSFPSCWGIETPNLLRNTKNFFPFLFSIK
jgi:hypothetical protein